jgi:hypothetical protein
MVMSRKSNEECCLRCAHFNNSPEYLESVFKGLTTLSSAYSSVRKQDGICSLRDLYLSAGGLCEDFKPAVTGSTPGPEAV